MTLPLGMLLAGLALCILGVVQSVGVAQRLPAAQRERYARAAAAAYQAGKGAFSPAARDGESLLRIARGITATITGGTAPAGMEPGIVNVAGSVRDGSLMRLHMIAIRLRVLEAAGASPETWWTSIQPLVDGLEGARFPMHQRAFIAAGASAMASSGLPLSVAMEWVQSDQGEPQGPFMQYFASRMTTLIGVLRDRGEAQAAAKCRLVLARALREWTLEGESAGIRLTAADLLRRFLDAEPADLVPPELPASLTELRSAYHHGARTRASNPFAFESGRVDLAPQATRAVIAALGATTWTGVANLTVGFLALALAWPALARGGAAMRHWQAYVAGGMIAVVAVVGAYRLGVQSVDALAEDVRRVALPDGSLLRMRLVPLAVGLSLLLLLAVDLLWLNARSEIRFVHRIASHAAVGWVACGVAFLWAGWSAERARAAYDREHFAAMQSDDLTAVVGDRTASLLAPLRAWSP